ncbi:MAG TPA: LamG-like jellyroll fold domain-containing protein, partial [Chthoniobacteraceae bacterium]|nr:LamG-like jellyroll fold domain-containing protein [Chthoniobacteraceae bacterium]
WWQRQPVATVARLESAQWHDNRGMLRTGDKLARGRFALASGFAALRFVRGAELLVEGPAEFELISPNRVRFRSGNVFAHVPQQAIGFTIEGPTGRVVDRGTDFGVHIGEKGMEVHVLKGLVEAGRGRALQPLRENQAIQMSAKQINTIPADAGRFLTNLPPKSVQPVGWVHWRLDENEGEETHSTGAGMDGVSKPAKLLSLEGASRGPQWTNGQFGSALSFDGKDDYVQTDFSGISGSAARTVAFWIKVPRDFEPKNGYAIVCWGSTKELTEGWQISVNPKEDQAPLGCLRVARIGGPILGTTDLRDDRWHHVAVVLYGSEHASVSTQVLIYIDGNLERTVRKGMLNVRTDTAGPNTRKVAFGLNIGPANPDPSRPPAWRVFRGCLDEIFICDSALTQQQVRELMLRNHTQAFAGAGQH